ncbi:MAG: RluA family pseudouridine synthase [Endomicrobiaceae bacterium]|jgi:23S rRNA pseudouridine1911/1915/1917 synthase|nr:RluA family pseudouridine synthase [Endomicrobiaceae bacterium]
MKNSIICDSVSEERLDCFMNKQHQEYSRTYFQKMIKEGKLLVNGNHVLPSYKVKNNDKISYILDETAPALLKPEKIPLNIIYEDDDIIIINKQADLVVHPSYGHENGTLLNALLWHFKGKCNPFMVHRLDKDTTGAIIFAKNEKSKVSLSKQFQKRAVKKIYVTAVCGTVVEEKGRIEAPLGRSMKNRKIIEVGPLAKKMAITEFKVLSRTRDVSLLEVHIITGRTHQIRSHMKYIGHPVVGDIDYGGCEKLNNVQFTRQMLHSYRITFTHPVKGKMMEFVADMPNDMKDLFKNIKL